jgi:hypothetical protein
MTIEEAKMTLSRGGAATKKDLLAALRWALGALEGIQKAAEEAVEKAIKEQGTLDEEKPELCAECGKEIPFMDEVWIDPKSTLATTGKSGKPYHIACAPEEKSCSCYKCHEEITDADDLRYEKVVDGEYPFHRRCVPGYPFLTKKE